MKQLLNNEQSRSTTMRPTGNGTFQAVSLVDYHVVPHDERWDVERDDTFTGQFSRDVNVAIGLAIASARQEGEGATVCLQQLMDLVGTYGRSTECLVVRQERRWTLGVAGATTPETLNEPHHSSHR